MWSMSPAENCVKALSSWKILPRNVSLHQSKAPIAKRNAILFILCRHVSYCVVSTVDSTPIIRIKSEAQFSMSEIDSVKRIVGMLFRNVALATAGKCIPIPVSLTGPKALF